MEDSVLCIDQNALTLVSQVPELVVVTEMVRVQCCRLGTPGKTSDETR